MSWVLSETCTRDPSGVILNDLTDCACACCPFPPPSDINMYIIEWGPLVSQTLNLSAHPSRSRSRPPPAISSVSLTIKTQSAISNSATRPSAATFARPPRTPALTPSTRLLRGISGSVSMALPFHPAHLPHKVSRSRGCTTRPATAA